MGKQAVLGAKSMKLPTLPNPVKHQYYRRLFPYREARSALTPAEIVCNLYAKLR